MSLGLAEIFVVLVVALVAFPCQGFPDVGRLLEWGWLRWPVPVTGPRGTGGFMVEGCGAAAATDGIPEASA